jgi:hypothetical protein
VCVFERERACVVIGLVSQGCKKASVPILVKCNHTQIINKITSLHVDLSEKKGLGDKLHQKGKRGDLNPREYFINISKKYNLWIFIYPKFLRDGNEYPIMTMQIYG